MELSLVKSEQFGDVTADIYRKDDEIYMTAAQLCACLGEARDTFDKRISRNPYLCTSEFSVSDKLSGTDGKPYATRLFNEDGIYEITMLSKSQKGQEFRAWIRGVIKSIRKHGAYMTAQTLTDIWTQPENVILLMEKLAGEMQSRIALEAEVQALTPKAAFADAVSESDDAISLGEMAKILRQNGLPYGRNRLCEALRRDGFLVRQDCVDFNTPTQWAMERGVFYHCKFVGELPNGLPATRSAIRVTGKGQQVLLQHFQREHQAGEAFAQ